MFNIFKRKRSNDWQIIFLQKIIIALGKDFIGYNSQLKTCFIKGFDAQDNGIPNFVSIKYYPNFFKEFENKKGEIFKLVGIKIETNLPTSLINADLYFGYGILLGYSIRNIDVSKEFDILNIIISDIKKENFDNSEDSKSVIDLLSNEEVKYISKNDIYIVTILNQAIYHLVDTEDGDFIGIDLQNKIYKVTHDPIEITPLDRQQLIRILKDINV